LAAINKKNNYMFGDLTINSKNTFNTAGTLAESLIFYNKTHLILDPGSFAEALRYCGYENLKELIRAGALNIKYSKHALGGGNYKDNTYLISAFSSDEHKKNKIIKKAVEEVHGRNIQARNMATHLNRIIPYHDYSDEYIRLLKKELHDIENLKSAITIVSNGQFQPDDIQITSEQIRQHFYNIESNVDKETINDAVFLISTGSASIYDAEINDSGLVTNSKISNYSESKLNRIIKQRSRQEGKINIFHEMILPEYIDLKGTIDSGAKSFSEFMEVWREAQQFKSWLTEEAPPSELITAYVRKIGERTWLDSVPTKNMRWLLFAGIGTFFGGEIGGVLGTTVGLGVDYFDDLILNKLINNWKPNQYIEGEYRDFLNLRIEE
jgi:hypothetical protein